MSHLTEVSVSSGAAWLEPELEEESNALVSGPANGCRVCRAAWRP